MKSAVLFPLLLVSSICFGKGDYTSLPLKTVLAGKPDRVDKNIRIWNIRKTDTIRVNLVEVTGELFLHKHPDADHSLMILEGKMRVQIGDDKFEIEKGDFISVPKDIPHKYWPIGRKVLMVSMDAPYYDPKKVIRLE